MLTGQYCACLYRPWENAQLWDVEGTRYSDFGTGMAVCNTGHTHPRVTAAVQRQLERFSHTCVMLTPYDTAVELASTMTVAKGVAGGFPLAAVVGKADIMDAP